MLGNLYEARGLYLNGLNSDLEEEKEFLNAKQSTFRNKKLK
mgnify:CR=1 FL=1